MRFILTLTTAIPSSGVATAALYATSDLGAPAPVSVGVSVVLFWLVAYRIASLLEAIAAHRAASRG